MKKVLRYTLIGVVGIYMTICALLYILQENLIFFPQKLSVNYQFDFKYPTEEIVIPTADGVPLHGLLFKADSSKGLVYYLHGNAGSLASWGWVAPTYTQLGYDVFMLDYRGFGKSGGSIGSEKQLFGDAQLAYDLMKERYEENRMVVLGYSIGTGPAAYIASKNSPRMLVLQAPYYSLVDMMEHTYPFVPTFLLKYRFETNTYLPECKAPVVIFHGDADRVIYYGSSLKLKELMKPTDRLVTLEGHGHNGITENPVYQKELQHLLR